MPIADALLDLDEQGCPGEIVTYVHGVWSNGTSAQEQAERVALSIDATNNYETLLVGFSWDSDTEVSPVGWRIAKIIANGNGPLLAKFISDYKHHCPDDKIRVASHSLGARVVLSALQTLAENTTTNNNNSDWSRNGFKITHRFI
jgi:esterase/lipase superfamily enzyme